MYSLQHSQTKMYQNMANMGMTMPTTMGMGVYDDEDDYCHFGPTSIKSNDHNIFYQEF